MLSCVLLMDRPPLCPDSCPGHFACTEAGVCLGACLSLTGGDDDDNCESGYFCDYIADECVAECQDEDCPDNLRCDGREECLSYCEHNNDCHTGFVCNNDGECVEARQ